MLATRVLSALVLAPPTLLAIYLGSPYFPLLLALAAALMAWEWERLCGGRFSPVGGVIAASGVAVAALGGLAPSWGGAAIAVCVGLVGLLTRGAKSPGALWMVAGVPYIAVPVLALAWLRADAGYVPVFWLMAVVWGTDIGAYAAGRSIGGPLLAPRVSPKKTWSGLGGGVVAAFAVGAATGMALGTAWAPLALVSACLAVVAQAGDLAESAVKRHFGVKDASSLIPGHGGLLDRVDGIMTVAPAVVLLHLVAGGLFPWR